MNKTNNDTCFFFEEKFVNLDRTEDVFIIDIFAVILNFLFSLITCVGNFLIVFAIGKTRDLHSPSFVLLGCLAVSDLLVGLICQPLLAAFKIAELKSNYTARCTLEMLLHTTGWMTSGASALTLATVCVDRVLSLILHLRYKALVTVPRIFKAFSAVWIVSITVVVVRFRMGSGWSFVAIVAFLLPFLVIAVCTLKIFQVVRRHQRQINDQSEALSYLQSNTVNVLKCRKSTVTVLYIYGLFVIFYLPYFVVMVLQMNVVGFTITLRIACDYATTAVFMNSSLNPLVYCWRNREIRRAVKNILRRDRMITPVQLEWPSNTPSRCHPSHARPSDLRQTLPPRVTAWKAIPRRPKKVL